MSATFTVGEIQPVVDDSVEVGRAADLIEATVEVNRVVWNDPTSGRAVLGCALDTKQYAPDTIPDWVKKAAAERRGVTVCGTVGKIGPGDLLDIVAQPTRHSKYGLQLQAIQVLRTVRSDTRAVQSFLRGLPHIGPTRAAAIVKQFNDVIDVLENHPHKLSRVDGISEARATQICEAYRAATGRRDAFLFARTFPITQHLIARIIDHFEGRARVVITADPYTILDVRGAVFRVVDHVARAHFHLTDDDPRRIRAGALAVLRAITSEGHCYTTEEFIMQDYKALPVGVAAAMREVDMPRTTIWAGLAEAAKQTDLGGYVRQPLVTIEAGRVYPTDLYTAECELAQHLQRLLAA